MKLSSQFLRSFRLDRSSDIDVSAYPFNIPSLESFEELELNPKVTFLIGENGSGKSTLLEALAATLGINPEGGSSYLNFQTRASHSKLSNHIRIVRGTRRPTDSYFLRAESFYNVATAMENLALPGEPPKDPILHEFSHGEAFFKVAFDRLGKNGLYLFDEPEAALSPTRQLSFLGRMHDLCSKNCQLIIATHSPILLAYPNSSIFHFSDKGIRAVEFEETEHFQVTKNFLNNYMTSLDVLFAEEKN